VDLDPFIDFGAPSSDPEFLVGSGWTGHDRAVCSSRGCRSPDSSANLSRADQDGMAPSGLVLP